MIGVVIGQFPDGSPFTTAHVDRFIEVYEAEARAMRRAGPSKASSLAETEERIRMWKAIRKDASGSLRVEMPSEESNT